jgi:hypothetical protein
MSRILWVTTFILLIIPVTTCDASDEQPESPIATEEALTELGDAVTKIDGFKDNYYLYEARVVQLHNAARAFVGSKTEVTAIVERVTPYEVIVDIPKLERTRIVLKHNRSPEFGNLGTRHYHGPPSTLKYHMFAKPIGLRIAEEISLDLAKQLRKEDQLRIQGRIERMPIQIKSVFEPYVAAVIVDWKVVAYEPANDSEVGGY